MLARDEWMRTHRMAREPAQRAIPEPTPAKNLADERGAPAAANLALTEKPGPTPDVDARPPRLPVKKDGVKAGWGRGRS